MTLCESHGLSGTVAMPESGFASWFIANDKTAQSEKRAVVVGDRYIGRVHSV